MPTRKQRRREAKAKRHEYEFVYLDDEGNEVEPPPEAADAPRPKERASTNGSKAPATRKPGATRTTRGRRPPQPPSWQRAAKRALILGAFVFVIFSFGRKGHAGYAAALVPAVLYTILFIPFTYFIDRFVYRRWQAREAGGAKPTKKR